MYKEAKKLDSIRTQYSIQKNGHSCSSAVVESFGIDKGSPKERTALEIKDELRAAGYEIEVLWINSENRECPTLNQFLKKYGYGDYILLTGLSYRPHSMSLRNGKLTDTDMVGTGRRKVNIAYRVQQITK